jgi:hypothetical protein
LVPLRARILKFIFIDAEEESFPKNTQTKRVKIKKGCQKKKYWEHKWAKLGA